MLRIFCPYCEEHREEVEFHYAGQAHIQRPSVPDDCSDETWGAYLYFRNNPRGQHREMWVHNTGCRKFFNMCRDTVTYEIVATYRLGETSVPNSSRAPHD